jgi:glucosamine-6-phosphate deaminase
MARLNLLEETRYEKLPVTIYNNPTEASIAVARRISLLINTKQAEGKQAVLGLATGVTPIVVYVELVRLHKAGELSFKNVITFNLDEYYPMQPTAAQSYVTFMHENLFAHIDIDPANIHIPDGTLGKDEVVAFCMEYEKQIEALGGLDLQILGIGRTGHIGFNEPGSGNPGLSYP